MEQSNCICKYEIRPIYTISVNADAKGLLIQGGKKFIRK